MLRCDSRQNVRTHQSLFLLFVKTSSYIFLQDRSWYLVTCAFFVFAVGYFFGKCGKAVPLSPPPEPLSQQLPVVETVTETSISTTRATCVVRSFWFVNEGKLHVKSDCGSLRNRTDVIKIVLCEHARSQREVCKKCS